MPTKVVTAKLEADALSEALDALSKVVQNSRNAAVYQCVLASISKNRMTVRGTDLVVFIERHVPVEADGDGIWLITFKQFYHYVKNVTGAIELKFGKDAVAMSRLRSHGTAKLRDPKEFMSWPKWANLKELKADASQLVTACRQSIPSVSDTFVDPALYNVSLKPYQNGSTDVQASNNHRYQIYRIPMSLRVNGNKGGVLIPLNGAIHLAELQGARKVALGNSMLGIQTKSGHVFCNLATGDEKYPEFAKLLPTKTMLTIVANRKRVRSVITLAKGFADVRYRRTRFTIKNGTLLVESSVQTGGFRDTIKLKKCVGKPLSLLVDADDVERFLELCQSDDFIVKFTGNKSQFLFRDAKQPNFWYVANPLVEEETTEKETKDDTD